MAISYVGTASNNTNNVTSMTVDVSAIGIQDFDIIIFFGSCDGNGYNTPAGFTTIRNTATGGSHTNTLAYKVASSEPTSYSVTTVTTGERGIGIFAVYRGADPVTPIDGSTTNIGGSNTTVVFNSLTPTLDNSVVVACVGAESGNNGNAFVTSWPGALIERNDNVNGPAGTGAASSSGALADNIQATATAVVGSAPITTSNTFWGAMSVSLNPIVGTVNFYPTTTQNSPANGSGSTSTTPTLSFVAVDPEGDAVEYNIQVDTVNTFDSQGGGPLISAFSSTDTGFSSGHPFVSGVAVDYLIQSALGLGTHYWRVAAIDPGGSNSYGPWSDTWIVNVDSSTRQHLVQRGIADLGTSTSNSVTLNTPIDTSRTWIKIWLGLAGLSDPSATFIEAYFPVLGTGVTSFNLDRYRNTSGVTVYWQVISMGNINVQHLNNIAFSTSTTSISQPITALSGTNKAFAFVSGRVNTTNGASAHEGLFSANITSNTNVDIVRGAASLAGTATAQVVEFTDTTTVEHQSIVVSNTLTDTTLSNSVDTTVAFTIFTYNVSAASLNTNPIVELTSSTNLQIRRGSASNTTNVEAYVVNMPGVAKELAVGADVTAIPITVGTTIVTDISAAFTIFSLTNSGTGTTWANELAAAIIDSTTQDIIYKNNTSNTTAWSLQTVQLPLELNSPPAVALNSPADGVFNQSTTPTFNFTATDPDGNSVEYEVQIDTLVTFDSQAGSPLRSALSSADAGFTPGHPFASGAAINFTVQAGNALPNNTNYYWRVRAIDPLGVNAFGLWSETRGFTVGNLTPTVTLNSPNDGDMVALSPTVYFTALDPELDAVEYNVQIDTVNTFDSQSGSPLLSALSSSNIGFSAGHPFVSGSEVQYTTQSVLALGIYYWRVAAIDPSGSNTFGAWSAIQSFETVSNAPPAVVANMPNDAATGVPPLAVLRFTGTDPEGDAVEYELQVDTVSSFNSNGGGSAPTIFTDSFEVGGWTSVSVAGTGGAWTSPTSSVHPAGIAIQNGSRIAAFNSYTSRSGAQARYYTSATFNLTASAVAARLSFWMYHETGYTTANDSVQLQVSTNGGSNWTNVGAAVLRYDGTTGWAQVNIDMSSYIGKSNIQLAFLGISVYGNDCYIDNVVVDYDVPLLYRVSSTDTGFSAGHPFTSGVAVEYTLQPAEILSEGTNYFWRARGIDPLGRNAFGSWSAIRSFVPNTGMKVWNSAAWSYKPLKVWNGSAWIKKPVKVWNGTEWVVNG